MSRSAGTLVKFIRPEGTRIRVQDPIALGKRPYNPPSRSPFASASTSVRKPRVMWHLESVRSFSSGSENPSKDMKGAEKKDEVKKEADTNSKLDIEELKKITQPPSKTQLKLCFVAGALPFLGFGFLDNFLMILFGDFIDGTLCVQFSFSTMAAAAIGNTISDVAGIFSGGAVEEMARWFGVEEPEIDKEQKDMMITKIWSYTGQVIGIVTGCILGCAPLLWLDPDAAAKLKQEKVHDQIFQHVVEKVTDMLEADAAMLMFVDNEKGDLYSRNVTKNLKMTRWKREDGFIGHTARTGNYVNAFDVHEESYYDPNLHENFLGSGLNIRSLLCMPIWSDGKVIGCIVVLNKHKTKDGGVFTTRDEDILGAISMHVSITVNDSADNIDRVLDACDKSVNRQGAPGWNPTTNHRRKVLFHPLLTGISELLGVDAASVMLLNERDNEMYTEASEGPVGKHRGGLHESFAGWTVERGQVLNKSGADLAGLFSESMCSNYHGSGLLVENALVVPIFDTRRKCLGAFEILNKRHPGNGSGEEKGQIVDFDGEEVQYVQTVCNYIALMLEGPTAELRRVMALTNQLQQHKKALGITGQEKSRSSTVVVYVERLKGLELVSDKDQELPSCYVTAHIVNSNPLIDQTVGLQNRMLARRRLSSKQGLDDISKSKITQGSEQPSWEETLALPLPDGCKIAYDEQSPLQDPHVHILVWAHDSKNQDRLLAQTIMPLWKVPRTAARGPRPFSLYEIPGQPCELNLEKAKLWISFTRCWENSNAKPSDESGPASGGAAKFSESSEISETSSSSSSASTLASSASANAAAMVLAAKAVQAETISSPRRSPGEEFSDADFEQVEFVKSSSDSPTTFDASASCDDADTPARGASPPSKKPTLGDSLAAGRVPAKKTPFATTNTYLGGDDCQGGTVATQTALVAAAMARKTS